MGKRIVEFFLSACTFVLGNWGLIASTLAGAAGMTWAATATDWLKVWGPIGWMSACLLGLILGALFFALIQIARSKISQMRLNTALASRPHATNPLRGNFVKESLDLRDFFVPSLKPYKNFHFEDSRLIGPAVVHLVGQVVIDGGHFHECNYVVLKPDSVVGSIIVFENPRLVRTDLYFVTLILDPANAKVIRDKLKVTLVGYEIE